MQATEILVDFLAAGLAAEGAVAVLLGDRVAAAEVAASSAVGRVAALAPPKSPAPTLILSPSGAHKHEQPCSV